MNEHNNVFVIGATKAGTTTLHALLNSHPLIRMAPVKETYHFCPDLWPLLSHVQPLDSANVAELLQRGESRHNGLIKNTDTYRQLLDSTLLERYSGEACPFYLRSVLAPKLIHEFNPRARLIIIVRDPIKRAHSHYLMEKRDALTQDTFEEAILEEFSQLAAEQPTRHGFLESGLYTRGLQRFSHYFSKDQLLILDIDDLNRRPQLDQKLGLFLRIDAEGFATQIDRLNDWGEARHQGLNRLLAQSGLKTLIRKFLPKTWIETAKAHFYQPSSGNPSSLIPASLITTLEEYYRDDVRQLTDFLETPHPNWVMRYL